MRQRWFSWPDSVFSGTWSEHVWCLYLLPSGAMDVSRVCHAMGTAGHSGPLSEHSSSILHNNSQSHDLDACARAFLTLLMRLAYPRRFRRMPRCKDIPGMDRTLTHLFFDVPLRASWCRRAVLEAGMRLCSVRVTRNMACQTSLDSQDGPEGARSAIHSNRLIGACSRSVARLLLAESSEWKRPTSRFALDRYSTGVCRLLCRVARLGFSLRLLA